MPHTPVPDATTSPDPMTLPQGDVGLLETDVAQRLLVSRELARIGYVAHDDTPRVFPMLFHWNGEEVVLPTFGGAKVKALRARPAIAITIDVAAATPEVLLIRGRAAITEVDGILPEYRLAHERYSSREQAAATLAELERPGQRMTRIAVRPEWVGVLDFTTRFPGATSADEFEQRGRS